MSITNSQAARYAIRACLHHAETLSALDRGDVPIGLLHPATEANRYLEAAARLADYHRLDMPTLVAIAQREQASYERRRIETPELVSGEQAR